EGTVASGAIKGSRNVPTSAPGYDKGATGYTKEVDGAAFYGVENYQPTKEWASFTGERLDFTGSTETYSRHKYSKGLLTLNYVYSNDKTIPKYSWDAISGPWKNSSLENGVYRVDHLRDNRTGSYAKYGVGFSYDVSPTFSTGRDFLRIHPDGGPFGTLGCIGLTGSADVLRQVRNQMNLSLKNYGKLDLNVNIERNPNNNGR
ncbi:MAG: hypothetical protein DRI84_07725, partial [Bacteroidetes bacterium]